MQDWGALLTSMIFPGLYNDGRQVESPVVIGQFITGKSADSYRPDGKKKISVINMAGCVSLWNATLQADQAGHDTEIGDVFRGKKMVNMPRFV